MATLHPELRNVVEKLVQVGKYDEAIFAAFRFVEGEIQERTGTKSVGMQLLDDAFDSKPPRVLISFDDRDQQGIKSLFLGALTNIRNDRGHKRTPFMPCTTPEGCELYLAFASFLLHLLDKDKNTFPEISSVRVFGSVDQPRAEIRGVRFTDLAHVFGRDGQLPVLRATSTLLEVQLPEGFVGVLTVEVNGNTSNSVYCDTQSMAGQAPSYYEVVSTDVPLYQDRLCSLRRKNVVGLVLRATEGGREFLRIVPTYPGRYKAGFYVTHGPFEETSVGESWFRHPQTTEIEYAWTGALVAVPNVICPSGNFRLGGIAVQPSHIKADLNDKRTLRVVGWGKDGSITRELDITPRVSWKTTDGRIVGIQKAIVYPKALGRTTLECSCEGFTATAEVSISNHPEGERAVFFQGIRRMQAIRFDSDDNLYICNQAASVFRIGRNGGLEEVVRIPLPDTYASGIDCLAIDSKHNLYVNHLLRSGCLRFEWDGRGYLQPKSFAVEPKGAKKGIAVDPQGNVFVAVMGAHGEGYVLSVRSDGVECFFRVPDSITHLAVDHDGHIFMPGHNARAIFVYESNGTLLEKISHGLADSPTDILVTDTGTLYVPFFQTGKVLEIHRSRSGHRIHVLPHVFEHPGGIAMDSKGRLYVSSFTGDTINVIY